MRKKISIIVLIISLFCYANLSPENIDEYVSRRIREDLYSPCMDKTMQSITEIGSYKVSSLILLSMYTLGNENLKESTKLSTFSIVGATLTCALIKFSVNRKRPCGSSPRINSSFPAGHATGAFAFSYVIGKRHPKTSIPLYLTATTVAFSRVYLGRHYLSDVIAGSILGITAGWLVMKNEQTILKIKF
ncbi:MAG: phosphatase PAP2 family protein [Candidatus Cloacimonadota bacterium]|nr:MAG: phosphatase PAP2 family protein [Candidatus Cloacimonadota bacterium]